MWVFFPLDFLMKTLYTLLISTFPVYPIFTPQTLRVIDIEIKRIDPAITTIMNCY